MNRIPRKTLTLAIAGLALLAVAACQSQAPESPPPPPAPAPPPAIADPGFEIADEDIQDRVHAALLAEPMLADDDIAVRVEEGRVWLTGRVDSEAERDMARQIALGVAGVTAVDHDGLDD